MIRDEIVSAMRHVLPVTHDTLVMVSNHISESVSVARPSGGGACFATRVPLQYVYTAAQSEPFFVQVCR